MEQPFYMAINMQLRTNVILYFKLIQMGKLTIMNSGSFGSIEKNMTC